MPIDFVGETEADYWKRRYDVMRSQYPPKLKIGDPVVVNKPRTKEMDLEGSRGHRLIRWKWVNVPAEEHGREAVVASVNENSTNHTFPRFSYSISWPGEFQGAVAWYEEDELLPKE